MTMNDVISLEVPLIGPEGYDELWDGKEKYSRYYDRRGNKITFREWASLTSHLGRKYKIVKQEHVGSYFISTVWLGLDHNFSLGRPLIFETMVFNEGLPKPPPAEKMLEAFEEYKEDPENFKFDYPEMTSWTDLDCERYSTEKQALAGHEAMVEKVRLIVEATS